MISVGLFALTLFYLRCRKRYEDVKRQLEDVGTAVLFTGAAFVIVFLFHILILAPRASAEENQPAREKAETARTTKSATPAPLPFQVTENDPQAGKQLEDTRKELTDGKETIPQLDPLVQPLVSAVSAVDITIKTTKDVNFHSFDRGGYAAIATALGPMLVTRGGDCSGKPSGAGEATFHGIFGEMTGASVTGKASAIGKPIADLRSASFIQIEFAPMEENPVVVRGQVIFTLNNSRQLHFEIPPQTGVGKKIYIRDLLPGMKALCPPAPTP